MNSIENIETKAPSINRCNPNMLILCTTLCMPQLKEPLKLHIAQQINLSPHYGKTLWAYTDQFHRHKI